jgi:hypothetical protein
LSRSWLADVSLSSGMAACECAGCSFRHECSDSVSSHPVDIRRPPCRAWFDNPLSRMPTHAPTVGVEHAQPSWPESRPG